jgi:hypothetical protein
MPDTDSFSFDKGLNLRKPSHLLTEGELQSCSGFSFDKDGCLTPMIPRVEVIPTLIANLGTIHDIHRYMNWLVVGVGDWLYYTWDMRGYCDLYTINPATLTTVGRGYAGHNKIVDYKDWVFMVNGSQNICFSKGYIYKWGIDNPTITPRGVAGASGNPSGTYYLCYTFLIKFPNGEIYETGPSSYGSVTVSSQKIEWSGIGICGYTGTGVVIERCLYRYSPALGAIFYVATINNNTDTTYSDDWSDATIAINAVLSTEEYDKPPDNIVDAELYLQRMFAIKDTFLYWSEPYLPFSFKTSSAMNFSSNGDNLMGVVYWGDQLYLASKSTWYRLPGTDPDTWQKKETYADYGIINTHTIAKTKYGVIGLGDHDGLYLFDGSTSSNITIKKLGADLFQNISDYKVCWGKFDGLKYRFFYPTTGSVPDKCLVVDFTYYPELRFYHDPFVSSAFEHHRPTKRNYYGKIEGIRNWVYEETTSGGEAIDLATMTGDKTGQGIFTRKNVRYIYYDVNTHGKDVTLTIYIDGTAHATTFTLNTSTRTRDRIEDIPADMEGYRFAIGLTCADVTDDELELYAPFAIEYTKAGT